MQFVSDMRDELWPRVPVLFTRYHASQPLAVPVREHDLRLSIVSSIVAAHGGTIGSHNAAEGGAVFCVTLPQTKSA
jgi:K+-sensing histidine kinase KdpD